jgi:hypothetical protein
MYNEITSETTISKGDWVREKSTGELCQIGKVIEGKFELRPKGKSTMLSSGVVFVADQSTLVRKYEIKSDG